MLTVDRTLSKLDEIPLDYTQRAVELREAGYSAKVMLDRVNSRLKVLRHEGQDLKGLIMALLGLARQNDFTKISVLGREHEWEMFIARGFVLEGILKGYYQGEDGYIVARFLDPKRRYNELLEKENQTMEEIVEIDVSMDATELPTGLKLRQARQEDAGRLADMYQRVFSSYPTPIFDADYLRQEIADGMLYKVIWDGEVPVSAAAADIDPVNRAAELTDCGTIPEYRGRGLITVLIHDLESELRRRDYRAFYGMARAVSYGMNLVFQRFGYVYRGRLINHAYISGQFEDLNIWVKSFS